MHLHTARNVYNAVVPYFEWYTVFLPLYFVKYTITDYEVMRIYHNKQRIVQQNSSMTAFLFYTA